jgi:hypothetical protein
MSERSDRAMAIEILLNTRSREAIVGAVAEATAEESTDWDGRTTRQILEELALSDEELGQANDGVLAAVYEELG